MKLKLAELRSLVKDLIESGHSTEANNSLNEELMAGIPEHQFRTATSEFIESVRQLLRRNILLDKSKDATQRQRAFVVANRILKDLEKEVSEQVQAALNKYDENT